MQFPLLRLEDNPALGIILRGLAGVSITVGVIMFVLGLVGAISWSDAAVFAGILIVYPLSLVWHFQNAGDGFAEITESHLFVKRKRGTNETYRLDDISAVRLKWEWWRRVPHVELKLRRSMMIGVRTANIGTDIAGIPTVFWKRARVLVEDTEGFAEELRRRLPPAGPSQTGDRSGSSK